MVWDKAQEEKPWDKECDMSEIWVIVRDTNVVHGHGDNSDEMVLAYKGYDSKAVFPAFTSKENAQTFMDKNCIGVFGRRLQRMVVQE